MLSREKNNRLTYGSGEDAKTVALLDKIETGLIPRVAGAMTSIEALVRDAMQRQHQSVQSVLENLSSRRTLDEQGQREFIEEIHRQVRNAADMHLAAAIKNLDEKFSAKLAELTPPDPQPPSPKRGGYWSRLGLL